MGLGRRVLRCRKQFRKIFFFILSKILKEELVNAEVFEGVVEAPVVTAN